MRKLEDVVPKEVAKCLYSGCTNIPTCRAENPEYSYHESHGRGWPKSVDGKCPSPFSHKFICDGHWDLLIFIQESDVIKFDVTMIRK